MAKKATKKKKAAQRNINARIRAGQVNDSHGGWESFKGTPKQQGCMQT